MKKKATKKKASNRADKNWYVGQQVLRVTRTSHRGTSSPRLKWLTVTKVGTKYVFLVEQAKYQFGYELPEVEGVPHESQD